MAQTYYVGEALTIVGGQVGGRRLEDLYGAYIANLAINEIWKKYDWKESIEALPPFYLIPQEQDYGKPAVVIPADLQGLRQVYLVQTAGGGPNPRTELKVRRDLRATQEERLPELIGHELGKQRLRVYPRVPAGIGSTDWIIDGTYKKNATKITPSTILSTLIPWEDRYLNVFIAAVKWAAFESGGDPRAGQVIERGRNFQYTGQLAAMHAAIDEMASEEGLHQGDPSIAPTEPLVGYGYGPSNLVNF